jgi:hypothetical protein
MRPGPRQPAIRRVVRLRVCCVCDDRRFASSWRVKSLAARVKQREIARSSCPPGPRQRAVVIRLTPVVLCGHRRNWHATQLHALRCCRLRSSFTSSGSSFSSSNTCSFSWSTRSFEVATCCSSRCSHSPTSGKPRFHKRLFTCAWRHHAGTSSITDIRSSSISNNSAAWSSA